MSKVITCIFSFLLCSVLIVGSCAHAADVVRVDPTTQRVVNGYGEVQRIFGVTANGSSQDQAIEEIRALHLNGTRAFLWPLYGWKAPGFTNAPLTEWAAGQGGGKGVPKQEALAQWKAFYAQDFDALFTRWWDEAFPRSSQPYQMELCKKWGVTDGIILQPHVIDGAADQNPEGLNHFTDAYLKQITQRFPELHIQFFQLTNEPNYPTWSGQFASGTESVQTWLRVFNRLDTHLRATHSPTTLLGPCLASSEFFSWGGWSTWTVPVLAGVQEPMRYFNYHLYDQGAYTNLAWMEMLQAKAEALGRPRPQGITTEMQYDLWHENDQQQRCRWWSEQLFTALAHPDKYYNFSYFLIAYANGFNKTNMFANSDGKYAPRDPYWVYWTLANTRGKALEISSPHNAAVRLFACTPNAQQVVVSVFNSGETPATLTLDPGLSTGTKVTAVTRRLAEYQGETMRHEQLTLPASATPVEVTLAPGGVSSLTWQLAGGTVAPTRTAQTQEFYARTVAQPFAKDLTVPLAVPRLPGTADVVSLRVAVSSDDLLNARGLTVVFNGHATPVYWNEAPRQTDTEARTSWWLDVPLRREWVTRENTVVFAKPDTDYRLMFASLVYQGYADAATAGREEAQALAVREHGISASLKPVPPLIEQGSAPFELLLNNAQATPVSYRIQTTLPSGLSAADVLATQTVTVPAHASRTLRGTLHAGAAPLLQEGMLRVQVGLDGAVRELTAPVAIYPARQAMCVSTPPTIDGKLDDWRAVPPVTYTIPGLTTKTRVAWDATNLYLAVEVAGAFHANRPDSVPNFWGKDAIEVFLDLGNQKSLLYDADDMQLFFCPLAVTGDAALGGKAIRQRQGDVVNIVNVLADPDMRTASVVRDTGYTLEGVIPWRTISPTFRPQPGAQLGCDVALDHTKNTDGLALSTSIFGLANKPFGQPNRWGTLTLLAPGVTPLTPKLIVPPAPEAAAAPDTTIRFSRTQSDGWIFPPKPGLTDAGLRLANGGGGANLLLKAPIPAPLTDAGVTTRFTIKGFDKLPGNAAANQPPFRTHLRAYWTPKLPEGFIEPYAMSDCLALLVEYRDEQTNFELYKKVGGTNAGWGPLLWSASTANTYPLTVTFWFNKTDYQVNVSTPVETRQGARSGQHGLPAELWAQPVRFGLKSVYGSQPADLIMETVEIKAGK